jgi:hypothetical protein
MEDAAFSDDFCRFLHAFVPSVGAAELLLELRARGEQGVQPRSHADRLVLEGLVGQGIAAALAEGFVYRAPEHLDAHVRTLAQAYKERPVTLFRVIYALRDIKVQSFADAFRVRKKD